LHLALPVEIKPEVKIISHSSGFAYITFELELIYVVWLNLYLVFQGGCYLPEVLSEGFY